MKAAIKLTIFLVLFTFAFSSKDSFAYTIIAKPKLSSPSSYESYYKNSTSSSAPIYKKGYVKSSVSSLAKKLRIPTKVINQAVDGLSNLVDFNYEIRKNAKFEIIYQKDKLLYASIKIGRKKKEIFAFKRKNDKLSYFDKYGNLVENTISRKPITSSARMSSKYGWRIHPIHKVRKMHRGVDYAAPGGTPFYAAGNGVIIEKKYNGGYGNYIKIRHNNRVETAYAHARSFPKRIKKGKRVKKGDVIGYVGSTGSSTGNHLHYEVIKNGKKVDPLKTYLTPDIKLSGKDLQEFKKIKKTINRLK